MTSELDRLELPIVQAPMGGGPSTPALAAAVSEAGGLGFLAAGYKTVSSVQDDIEAVRAATDRPFGVNVFAPPGPASDVDPGAVARYADRLGPGIGEPRHDDDDYSGKLSLLRSLRVPVVSFTFGCPTEREVAALQGSGCEVWVTVTTAAEAVAAGAVGADAAVVQGVEAGGHRGSFDDSAPGDLGLVALMQAVRTAVDLPLVATGGIMTGRAVAAALAAGATAVQLGTAFMLTPEAGTAQAHRDALAGDAPTALTRAFTGRTARGIVNGFMRDHDGHAPSAYPDVHHVTQPLRAAARERGDADGFHLWAGQAYPLVRAEPAADLARRLCAEARSALREAAGRV